ncbi:hypothetical protein BDD12DRAFT_867422 [Trichophaea hybrida]|nr:hypothetical protein BDD12DRAFT_867422 [Trichophaea hybrida]
MPPSQSTNKQITIYLTGFGNFSRITDNPSWSIVSSFLKPVHQTVTLPDCGITILFLPHPTAVKVSYPTVDDLIPQLWASRKEGWEYILHIGVGHEGGFELETQCWEKGYKLKDVDGCIPSPEGGGDGKKKKKKENGMDMKGVHGSENTDANRGEGRLLKTAFDVQWVVDLVERDVTPKEDKGGHVKIKVSNDPGLIYVRIYSGRLFWRRKTLEMDGGRGWRFLHVPPEGKRYGIQTGRDVVLKVVEGMVRDGEGLRED